MAVTGTVRKSRLQPGREWSGPSAGWTITVFYETGSYANLAQVSMKAASMDTPSPSQKQTDGSRRVGPIVVGIILFTALMTLRNELSSVWTRALVAGCAFVVLTGAILLSRRRQSEDPTKNEP